MKRDTDDFKPSARPRKWESRLTVDILVSELADLMSRKRPRWAKVRQFAEQLAGEIRNNEEAFR